jgi:cytidylate kinase
MSQTVKATLRCGDTLHVLVAETATAVDAMVESTTARLLRPNGHAVVGQDGAAVWIADEVEHPLMWSADGNRVRARRVRHTVTADGRRESTVLRRVFVSL